MAMTQTNTKVVPQLADELEAVAAAFPKAMAAAAERARAEAVKAERARIMELHKLAANRPGFDAELSAAIESGADAGRLALDILAAEAKNPLRGQLEQRRRDGDLGVPGSIVETMTRPPVALGPEEKAKAAWDADADMRASLMDFQTFLYSDEIVTKLGTTDALAARAALTKKGRA